MGIRKEMTEAGLEEACHGSRFLIIIFVSLFAKESTKSS